MQTSEQIDQLATALAKAQGSMHGALKDSANPFFKSKYADLESVWTACRKALSENGLSVVQSTSGVENGVAVTTTLLHASGQWMRDTLPLHPKDTSPQGIGSAITYGRRYALAAMVGVYQTDDDGEAAQGRGEAPHGISQAEIQSLAKRFREVHDAGIDAAMLELHESANKDQELYGAAWALLSAPARRRIKEGIDKARAAREGREYVPPQPRGPKAA